MVHIVRNKCGGNYGFISSHASNSFAITSFLWIIFGKNRNQLKIILLIWATIMIYSRIYLGVHYPGDVIAGAIWGMIIGVFFGAITRKIAKRDIT
jgi:undecaprenyl-diphosphatase